MTSIERLLAKVEVDGDCLTWTGSADAHGGRVVLPGQRRVRVHRLAYECWHGPIPLACEVGQRCGNRLCVNPDHLVLRVKQPTSVDPLERLLECVEVDADQLCWMWVGSTDRNGFARLRLPNRGYATPRRLAFERWCGPIPAEYEVVTRCERKLCVNPDHLTVRPTGNWSNVDTRELDRESIICDAGHLVLGDNAVSRRQPWGEVRRECRTCRDEWLRRPLDLLPDPRQEYRDGILANRLARLLGVAA